MRSARVAIAVAALVLVLLPLVAVGIAWTYERMLTWRFESALAQVASEAARDSGFESIAEREHVELFRLDRSGNVLEHSSTRELAVRPSSMAQAMSGLSSLLGERAPRVPWRQLDADAGPLGKRGETLEALAGRGTFTAREASNGAAVLYSYAAPTTDGVLYVQTATVRGLRRLVALRGELVRLSLYQLLGAALFVLLLGRWLVKPLERLADRAAAFGGEGGLADPDLLRRQDEVGTLARALDALTRSLEERRRATVDLAADMAHELKNPLATIAASAELIGTTRDPTPEKRGMVQTQITSAVDRLRVATDELLSLVRLEASLPTQSRERVDLGQTIEEVISEYRSDPRFEGIRFEISVAQDAREVELATSAWKRMLRNLLDNAVIQPMQVPRVDLSARRCEDGLIELIVRDYGPGISEGNRDKIFRRFFTQRPEAAPPGTGLGLSIVRTVAQAHGGELSLVEVDGPGGAFRVTFRG